MLVVFFDFGRFLGLGCVVIGGSKCLRDFFQQFAEREVRVRSYVYFGFFGDFLFLKRVFRKWRRWFLEIVFDFYQIFDLYILSECFSVFLVVSLSFFFLSFLFSGYFFWFRFIYLKEVQNFGFLSIFYERLDRLYGVGRRGYKIFIYSFCFLGIFR